MVDLLPVAEISSTSMYTNNNSGSRGFDSRDGSFIIKLHLELMYAHEERERKSRKNVAEMSNEGASGKGKVSGPTLRKSQLLSNSQIARRRKLCDEGRSLLLLAIEKGGIVQEVIGVQKSWGEEDSLVFPVKEKGKKGKGGEKREGRGKEAERETMRVYTLNTLEDAATRETLNNANRSKFVSIYNFSIYIFQLAHMKFCCSHPSLWTRLA